MLRTVIIEDEKNILDMMKWFINKNSNYDLVGTYLNPSIALKEVPVLDPDVLFIDIEMPKQNGIELARKLKKDQNQIIFTTAYSQYALDAFHVQATDYLLKPVTEEAISKITERLIKTKNLFLQAGEPPVGNVKIQCFGSFVVTDKYEKIVRWPTQKTEEMFAYFLIRKTEIVSKWELADVLWQDKSGDKAVHNVHNTIYRLKKTLKEFELPIEINTINHGYSMNVAQEVIIDLDIALNANSDLLKDREKIREFCKLYKGSLFQNKDYHWSIYYKESLEILHMNYC
ncbi:hypothetical protein BTR22_03100 [Alkalihalophilus pseudofirmus]|uniref:response regulator n=1 Tax=Alkalihalophilus pseudofirmus TaxID=79885 RepID=UPI0009528B19|nr:hypothetical protein BTR22_03100 [Alkalihalophilus pseudofirmus]